MLFQRIEFDLAADGPSTDLFLARFEPVADNFGMHVDLRSTESPVSTAILASRQPHCLTTSRRAGAAASYRSTSAS